MNLWLLPFALQAVVILVDELYCHPRRGLSRKETFSHLADSLLFLVCLVICTQWSPTPSTEMMFITTGILSTLLITKDEWIHASECDGFEHWLHALLFVLHPTALLSAWWVWHHPELQFMGWTLLPVGIFSLMILQSREVFRGRTHSPV